MRLHQIPSLATELPITPPGPPRTGIDNSLLCSFGPPTYNTSNFRYIAFVWKTLIARFRTFIDFRITWANIIKTYVAFIIISPYYPVDCLIRFIRLILLRKCPQIIKLGRQKLWMAVMADGSIFSETQISLL